MGAIAYGFKLISPKQILKVWVIFYILSFLYGMYFLARILIG